MKRSRRLSAEAYAWRLLRVRPRSRQELATRLRQRGYDPEEIDRVLQNLEAAGLLNQEEYLESWILGQIRKLWSHQRIARELERQGFTEAEYTPLLNLLYNEDQVYQRLLERARRIAREAPNTEALKRRLWGFLARRGHPPEVFYRLLHDLQRNG